MKVPEDLLSMFETAYPNGASISLAIPWYDQRQIGSQMRLKNAETLTSIPMSVNAIKVTATAEVSLVSLTGVKYNISGLPGIIFQLIA